MPRFSCNALFTRAALNRLLALMVIVTLTVALGAWAYTSPDSELARWLSIQMPVAAIVVWTARRASVRHERRWAHPAARLAELIEEIRAGDAPIDSLSEISNPLKPVALSVMNLARDLRTQRREAAVLQTELQQRVRLRTDSLERSMAALRSQATRDALTGLYNRRMLDEHLPRLIEQCHSEGSALSLMVIDLDNFKLLNDTLGHQAGDNLLRALSDLLRSSLRGQDLAFRNGGDEFVILLPGCSEREGQDISRRIQSLTDQLVKPLRVARKPGVSIGLVSCDHFEGMSPAALLHRADEAMYQAKLDRKGKQSKTACSGV